jgi:hypothetical protein
MDGWWRSLAKTSGGTVARLDAIFCEFICSLIIPACDVVEFETVKLVLKAPYLFTVGFHLGVTAARAFHNLIDHELGVAPNIEVSDP